jgi:hypothetical protein
VRVAVIDKTHGDQVPWTEDGIQRRERIQFGGDLKLPAAAEREWQQYGKDTQDIRLLEAFKEKHKADPVYVRLAEARLEELKREEDKRADAERQAMLRQQQQEEKRKQVEAEAHAKAEAERKSMQTSPLEPKLALPEIKISKTNRVPECATPGRMMRYLKARNPELDPRFADVATEYMRLGEALGVRWDFAFYQMIIETGSLSYRRGNRSGDVKAWQNNFAGFGAVGGGAAGESFKDIATGVRAHLEHLLLYAGDTIENPTAERTRKVQEWGVLTAWHKHFTRPINFSDLAQQWAPGSNSYGKLLEDIAARFTEFCVQPDPHPEMVKQARP